MFTISLTSKQSITANWCSSAISGFIFISRPRASMPMYLRLWLSLCNPQKGRSSWLASKEDSMNAINLSNNQDYVQTFRNFDVVSAAASSILGFGKMDEIQHMHSYSIAFPMLLAVSPFLNMSPNTVYICPLACLSPLPSTASIFNNFICR